MRYTGRVLWTLGLLCGGCPPLDVEVEEEGQPAEATAAPTDAGPEAYAYPDCAGDGPAPCADGWGDPGQGGGGWGEPVPADCDGGAGPCYADGYADCDAPPPPCYVEHVDEWGEPVPVDCEPGPPCYEPGFDEWGEPVPGGCWDEPPVPAEPDHDAGVGWPEDPWGGEPPHEVDPAPPTEPDGTGECVERALELCEEQQLDDAACASWIVTFCGA